MTNKTEEEFKKMLKDNPVATIRLTLIGYDETIKDCFESLVTQLEQLKTLDKNVKAEINRVKNTINEWKKCDICEDVIEPVEGKLEYLESFYKTEQD